MRDGKIIYAAPQETRGAEDDLIAKLREANTLDIFDFRAVILETAGDISVLDSDNLQDCPLQVFVGPMKPDNQKTKPISFARNNIFELC